MKIQTVLEDKQVIVEQRVSKHWQLAQEITQGMTDEQRRVVENIVLATVPLHSVILEAALSGDQINQLFGNIEKSSTSAGGNRTLAGKGMDAAGAVNNALDKVGKYLQNTAPVKAFDEKFEKLKGDLKAKLGGDDSKVVQFTQKLGELAKENPGKTAAIIGLMTAAAGIAGGPVGGAIAGKLLRGGMELVKGEKVSTAVGKGMKQAAAGAAIGAASDAVGDFFGGDAADAVQGAADAQKVAGAANFNVGDYDSVADAKQDLIDAAREANDLPDDLPDQAVFNKFVRGGDDWSEVQGAVDNGELTTGAGDAADAGDGQGVRVRTFDNPDDAGTDAASDAGDTPAGSAGGKPAGFADMTPDDQADELMYIDAKEWTPEDLATMQSTGNLTDGDLQSYFTAHPDELAKKLGGDLNKLDDLLNGEYKDVYDNLPSTDREQLSGYLEQIAKKGGADWSGAAESVIPTGKKLSEGQIYLLFNKLVTKNNRWLEEGIAFESVFDAVRRQNLEEGPLDALKKGVGAVSGAAGALAKKGMQKLSTAGKNLTTKVTADKLQKAWKNAGSPTDSNVIASILAKAGVNADLINTVYSDMGIEAPKTSDQGATDDTTATTSADATTDNTEKETPADATGATSNATDGDSEQDSTTSKEQVDLKALAALIKQLGVEKQVKQLLQVA